MKKINEVNKLKENLTKSEEKYNAFLSKQEEIIKLAKDKLSKQIEEN